jgi:hypothetical protein
LINNQKQPRKKGLKLSFQALGVSFTSSLQETSFLPRTFTAFSQEKLQTPWLGTGLF